MLSTVVTLNVSKYKKRYSIASMVLIVAHTKFTDREFSEFELTVETWKLEKELYGLAKVTGLKGFENEYPDHKKVISSISHRQKQVNMIKFLERIRPTIYRLTSLGKVEAIRLINDGPTLAIIDPNTHHRQLSRFASHYSFLLWSDNPDKPKNFEDVKSLFEEAGGIEEFRLCCHKALKWCNENNCTELIRSRREMRGRPITYNLIVSLLDFATAMDYRFYQGKEQQKC